MCSATHLARFSFITRALDVVALRGLEMLSSILWSTSQTSALSRLAIANSRADLRVMVVSDMVTYFLRGVPAVVGFGFSVPLPWLLLYAHTPNESTTFFPSQFLHIWSTRLRENRSPLFSYRSPTSLDSRLRFYARCGKIFRPQAAMAFLLYHIKESKSNSQIQIHRIYTFDAGRPEKLA